MESTFAQVLPEPEQEPNEKLQTAIILNADTAKLKWVTLTDIRDVWREDGDLMLRSIDGETCRLVVGDGFQGIILITDSEHAHAIMDAIRNL